MKPAVCGRWFESSRYILEMSISIELELIEPHLVSQSDGCMVYPLESQHYHSY